MELYILDSLLRRNEVVERYESLIWSERFADIGDFQLVIESSKTTGSWHPGTLLSLDESMRVMVVESVENTLDDEGRMMLDIKGVSLEEILKNRVARPDTSDSTVLPKWSFTGTPMAIAAQVFETVCIDGDIAVEDKIPYLLPGSIFAPGNLPTSSTNITVDLEPKSLYEAIKEICDAYKMGFRIVRNGDLSELYFDVFSGSDRTTSQGVLPPVVFSVGLDNLENTRDFTTAKDAKNMAYVISPVGFAMIYGENVPVDISGFDRRILTVVAGDIDDNDPAVAFALMAQRGAEALSEYKTLQVFDGEINRYSEYKYNVDYNLGDMVELQRNDGARSHMQVTEQIFVSDSNGDRTYPTLSVNQYVGADTWLGWGQNQVWFDLDDDTTLYWESV